MIININIEDIIYVNHKELKKITINTLERIISLFIK